MRTIDGGEKPLSATIIRYDIENGYSCIEQSEASRFR
jgi:hypothetical protein